MALRHHSSRALWRYPYILAGIFGKLTAFPGFLSHIGHGKGPAWLSLLVNSFKVGISLPSAQSLAEFGSQAVSWWWPVVCGHWWCWSGRWRTLRDSALRQLLGFFTTFSFPVFLSTELSHSFFWLNYVQVRIQNMKCVPLMQKCCCQCSA